MCIVYVPYFLAGKQNKYVRPLLLLKPFDFVLSGIYLFIISLFASPFATTNINNLTIGNFTGTWLFTVLANSYFFIVYPYLLKVQHKRFFFQKTLTDKYNNLFNNNIKIYVTNFELTNAMASGFFKNNRVIVIGNTLLERLTEGELFAIISHEEAHHKAKDLIMYFGLMSLATFVFIIGVMWFPVLISFVLPSLDKGFVIGIFGGLHALVFYAILYSKVSHNAEYRADIFAANIAGEINIINALNHLNSMTNGLLLKGSLTHPKLEKRILNIQENVDA